MATLRSNLSEITGHVGAAAERALLRTAADIVDLTKQITPVDTGNLKRSYGAVPVSSQVVHIGTDVEYAPYVEYGTSLMAAQPHLTPAFMQSEDTFRQRIKEEMEAISR